MIGGRNGSRMNNVRPEIIGRLLPAGHTQVTRQEPPQLLA
jgi:hypothetical protein